jgi:hypothetical protein
MSIEFIPPEVICMILEYCDTFKDYVSWMLVCKDWKENISGGVINVIKTRLISNMVVMTPETSIRSYEYKYISTPPNNNEITITYPNYISTFYFICWKPNIPFSHIKIIQNKERGMSVSIPVTTSQLNHPFLFASALPQDKTIGYLCVNYILKSVDEIRIKLDRFNPVLLAYK